MKNKQNKTLDMSFLSNLGVDQLKLLQSLCTAFKRILLRQDVYRSNGCHLKNRKPLRKKK